MYYTDEDVEQCNFLRDKGGYLLTVIKTAIAIFFFFLNAKSSSKKTQNFL